MLDVLYYSLMGLKFELEELIEMQARVEGWLLRCKFWHTNNHGGWKVETLLSTFPLDNWTFF